MITAIIAGFSPKLFMKDEIPAHSGVTEGGPRGAWAPPSKI